MLNFILLASCLKAQDVLNGLSSEANVALSIAPPVICMPIECPENQFQSKANCLCREYPYCTMDMCWDGRARSKYDCSCAPKPTDCTRDLCWDGSARDADCSCPPQQLCSYSCDEGYVLDLMTSRCHFKPVCDMAKTCDDGFELIADTCTCEKMPKCSYVQKCPYNQQFDF